MPEDHPLEAWNPGSWGRLLASLHDCSRETTAAPRDAKPQHLAGMGLSLDPPVGGRQETTADPGFRTTVWTLEDDNTTLSLMRLRGQEGSAQLYIELDGAETVVDSRCRTTVDGHIARVTRFDFVGEDTVHFGAAVELVPEAGEMLGGIVTASTRERREELLGILLRLRVDRVRPKE